MEISNNWLYKISIKSMFEEHTTTELIIKLTNHLIAQLNKINTKVKESRLIDDEDKGYYDTEFFDIIDSLEFLRQLADGTIKENEWDNFSFDGDFETMFNDYLSVVYDLGNERITLKNNISMKFMWVD